MDVEEVCHGGPCQMHERKPDQGPEDRTGRVRGQVSEAELTLMSDEGSQSPQSHAPWSGSGMRVEGF